MLPYITKGKVFSMYKILKRRQLNENVVLMEVDAPFIAKKALAGSSFCVLTKRAREYLLPFQTMTEKRVLLQSYSR